MLLCTILSSSVLITAILVNILVECSAMGFLGSIVKISTGSHFDMQIKPLNERITLGIHKISIVEIPKINWVPASTKKCPLFYNFLELEPV